MVGMWYSHHKSGKGVLYEKGEQSSSDSEVIVTDTNQFFDGNDTPFVISKGCILELKLICFPCPIYDWQMRDEDWRDNGVSGKFREELIKILEKPYNEREYEDLWQM
ncbi:hypothetical protein POTOM_021618 [Populus tomentosa]|uniref:Uncharacterized protein n=1 Tax=Populus tomentosa TaxID=118781 RepID=A0A8X7ZS85_POPTO|nr:hypothetical protein POTOM_021618 [Populus tomentosa]